MPTHDEVAVIITIGGDQSLARGALDVIRALVQRSQVAALGQWGGGEFAFEPRLGIPEPSGGGLARWLDPCDGDGTEASLEAAFERLEHCLRALEPRDRAVVLATGFFGTPRRLGVPGEDLPHLRRRPFDATPADRPGDSPVVGAQEQYGDEGAAVDEVGGRLAVISFHSLEDRIVKRFMRDRERGCDCPPDFPVCVCGKTPELRSTSRKAIRPSAAETAANPRSSSGRLRVGVKT